MFDPHTAVTIISSILAVVAFGGAIWLFERLYDNRCACRGRPRRRTYSQCCDEPNLLLLLGGIAATVAFPLFVLCAVSS